MNNDQVISRRLRLPFPAQPAAPTARTLGMDGDLPLWARRTNPIVQRELPRDWKVLLPDARALAQIIVPQALLALLLPLELLVTLALPLGAILLVGGPLLLGLYARALVTTLHTTASAMTADMHNGTLDALRATPLPASHIVLGKVAAGLWRSMEDLDVMLLGVALLGLPLLALQHVTVTSGTPEAGTWLVRVSVALGVLVLPLRLVLELFLTGALGVMLGAVVRQRALAVTLTLAATLGYYALVLLPRFLPLPLPLRIVWTVVLPLAVPLMLIGVALAVTQRVLRHR